MARYIDIDELMKLSQDITTFDRETQTFGCFSGVSDEDINTLATADVVEVEKARWKGAGMGEYYCSLCNIGIRQYVGQPYCSECGAKMEAQNE